MKLYGLIGYPLSHSFSKKYFTEKFKKEGISDCNYELFELQDLAGFPQLLQSQPDLCGLNVTIPHKQAIIPFLNELDTSAQKIGAVNVIKILANGTTKGFNSDYYGFKNSLAAWLNGKKIKAALVLGTGGASKAVQVALQELGIDFQLVSRNSDANLLAYTDLTEALLASHPLLINTTPLGMYPETHTAPEIPYHLLSEHHFLYDLVYNPEVTEFMKRGSHRGASVKNGLEMLIGQAEKAWQIWNDLN